MANTRDIIGDQATIDGLVSRTLTSLEEDGVSTLSDYALYKNDGIQSVNFPSVTSVGTSSFFECTALETAILPEAETLNSNAFSTCEKLKTLVAPKLKSIGSSAFEKCYAINNVNTSLVASVMGNAFTTSGIGELILPLCTEIGNDFCKGARVSVVDLTKNIVINQAKFGYAYSLYHLILRSSTMCTLSGTFGTSCPLGNGNGWIYVPSDLVSTYQADSAWSTYASQIVPISEYPKAIQGETITDSWSEIFASESNGTYSTKYSVGDIKYVDIGGTKLPMQIVGFDKDTLTAGGIAKITWISKGLLDGMPMTDTQDTSNGWADTKVRDFLRNVIYPQIESTVRSNIKAVDKTYKTKIPSDTTVTISDTLWVPSMMEMIGTSYENSGCTYTDFFNTNISRTKAYGGGTSSTTWYTRTVGTVSNFYSISASGAYASNGSSTASRGIALGFCT